MLYEPTPHGTNRLYLYKKDVPENQVSFSLILVFCDTLSIWGGYDSNTEEYFSWEFDLSVEEKVIRKALTRLGVK